MNKLCRKHWQNKAKQKKKIFFFGFVLSCTCIKVKYANIGAYEMNSNEIRQNE